MIQASLKLKIFQQMTWIIILGLIGIMLAITSSSLALDSPKVYYVDTVRGNDSHPGTSLNLPFKTLQHCANLAQPGETCSIRQGIYRETIKPRNSGTAKRPILFTAYQKEKVIIAATEVLNSDWIQERDRIYKTSIKLPFSSGKNQIFLDFEMLIAARWPNIRNPVKITRLNSAKADTGFFNGKVAEKTYQATYSQAALSALPDDFWAGGYINFAPGLEWGGQSGQVTHSRGGEIQFIYRSKYPPSAKDTPAEGDPFYLWGKLTALDSEKEWYWDSENNFLYLWFPEGTQPKPIEYKAREVVLDLSGKSYITVQNLTLLGGRIITDKTSHHLVLDRIVSNFATHEMYSETRYFGTPAIEFQGTDNQIVNSHILNSSGRAILATGSHHRIQNNVIHDVDYMLSGSNAVDAPTIPETTDIIVRNNTIFKVGGGGINPGSKRSKFSYNDVYNTGLQHADVAVFNVFDSGDSEGTEISYNLAHDNQGNRDSPQIGGPGIRLDSGNARLGASNYIIHHNLVWNTSNQNSGISVFGLEPGQINYQINTLNRIYNNTVDNGLSITAQEDSFLKGTIIANNLVMQKITQKPDVNYSHNLEDVDLKYFVNRAARDYRLQPNSPALDGGIKIPPYTDGYQGKAPDIGAFEWGKIPWVAGAVIDEQDLESLEVTCQEEGVKLSCKIQNLPLGRKLPQDFKLGFNPSFQETECFNQTRYRTHQTVGICPGLDLSSVRQNSLEIFVQISQGKQVSKGTVHVKIGDQNQELSDLSKPVTQHHCRLWFW